MTNAATQTPSPTAPTPTDRPFRYVFGDYSATFSAELQAKKLRLDELIGSKHWLSVGRFKEAVVRDLLRPFVPKRYEVSTGFVLSSLGVQKRLSHEIDVLIWDAQDYFPFFRADDFVIVPPEACRAVVQVKGRLTRKELYAALRNLDSLMTFLTVWKRAKTHVQRSVFAFELGPDLKFPEGIWDVLYRHYKKTPHTAESRADFSKAHDSIASLPWIRHITCLGSGMIEARTRASVDGAKTCYFAMKGADLKDGDGSTGLWVQDLVHGLVGGHQAPLTAQTLPGITAVLGANARIEAHDQVLVLPVPDKFTNREYRPIGTRRRR